MRQDVESGWNAKGHCPRRLGNISSLPTASGFIKRLRKGVCAMNFTQLWYTVGSMAVPMPRQGKGECRMRRNEREHRSNVVEYVIEYTDKSLPEDRKSFLDNQCIRAMRGIGSMPEGVESVRIVKRA